MCLVAALLDNEDCRWHVMHYIDLIKDMTSHELKSSDGKSGRIKRAATCAVNMVHLDVRSVSVEDKNDKQRNNHVDL